MISENRFDEFRKKSENEEEDFEKSRVSGIQGILRTSFSMISG